MADFFAKLVILLFWVVWLGVAFGPVLFYAKLRHDRWERWLKHCRDQNIPTGSRPDEVLVPGLIGAFLLIAGFVLAFLIFGNPEVQSAIIYRRLN